jgi:hypothetical protein
VETICNVLAIQSLGFFPDPGSVARIEKAAKLVVKREIPRNAMMVWPQGFGKESPQYPMSGRLESLGENLAKVCRSFDEFSDMEVVQRAVSWTTKNDIQASYRFVWERGYGKAHFFFVTHPLHLFRVRLVWYMTHPKGWTADFFPAPHPISWREAAHELVGCGWYCLILLPTWFARFVSR